MNSQLTCLVVLLAAVSVLQAMPVAEKGFESIIRKGVGDIWTDCSAQSDPAKIISVSISPDPPQKGKEITVAATVSLSKNVTGGQVAVKAKYGIITVINKEIDLCDIAKQASLPCPISSGTHTLKVSDTVPDIGGHISGNAKVTDQNGDELACINFDFHD